MPHHLVAAADAQKSLSVFKRRPDLRTLAQAQIFQQNFLIKILSPAYKNQIIGGQPYGIPDSYAIHPAPDLPPGKPALQAPDISPVPVQIENVGIQMTDFQFHVRTLLIFLKEFFHKKYFLKKFFLKKIIFSDSSL
jgi:hypothetical protein